MTYASTGGATAAATLLSIVLGGTTNAFAPASLRRPANNHIGRHNNVGVIVVPISRGRDYAKSTTTGIHYRAHTPDDDEQVNVDEQKKSSRIYRDPMEEAAEEAEKTLLDIDDVCAVDDLDCRSMFDDYFKECPLGEDMDDDGECRRVEEVNNSRLEEELATPASLEVGGELCDETDEDCLAFLFDNGETYNSDSITASSADDTIAASLQARRHSLGEATTLANWRSAKCSNARHVPVSRSDWVRKVAMDTYPIVACGSARGMVYIVDVEERKVLAAAEEGAHHIGVVDGADDGEQQSKQKQQLTNKVVRRNNDRIKPRVAKAAMETLNGKLDGGGVVSVAIRGKTLVASSGREGGVKLWKRREDDENHSALVPLGEIPGLQRTIATSLKFDSDGRLWIGCYDGTVRAYDVAPSDESSDDTVITPLFRSDFQDAVLDVHLCEELGVGVCATADGGAALFDLSNGQFFVGILIFDGSAARSVLIVEHRRHADDNLHATSSSAKPKNTKTPTHGEFSVVVGGMNGALHQIPLDVDPTTGHLDRENPFLVDDTTDTAVMPRHVGPVMTLATAPADYGRSGAIHRAGEPSGVFVSGGQDGSLRVWECSSEGGSGEEEERRKRKHQQCEFMYALTGYRLWMTSACTDGVRLVSDGGETSVVVRDFGPAKDQE